MFGVKGWLKILSYTAPKTNILNYSPWQLRKDEAVQEVEVVQGNAHGTGVIARLAGIDDRDAAAKLQGADIEILYSQLPESGDGSYYWADLIGLKVVTTQGLDLGSVDHLMETGANDVLVVRGEKERLIPFLQGQTVIRIDLDGKLLVVDWDPDF